MSHDIKRYADFLQSLGTQDVPHTGEGFFAHLFAVYRDLKKWGEGEEVCLAGLFHSIYGTEKFRLFSLPIERREEVIALIGEHAERVAYINCVMDRSTFDALVRDLGAADRGALRVRHRDTGEWLDMTPREWRDLKTMHLCDWLEQVPRSQEWDYRRDTYQALAEQLGGVALAAYERVYAAVPAQVP
jgi:hypothetical protein